MQQVLTAIPNEDYIRCLVGGKKLDLYKSSISNPKKKLSVDEKKAKIRVENIFNAMAKYDTPWWLSDDLRKIAYYQINESVLLVSFEKFKEAVSFAIGHPIEGNDPQDVLVHRKTVNRCLRGKI